MPIPIRAALLPFLLGAGCGTDDTSGSEGTLSRTTGGPGTEGTSATDTEDTPATTSETSTTGGDTPSETATSHGTSDDASDPTGDVPTAAVSIAPQGNALLRIDLATGAAMEVCTLPAASDYASITFTTNGTLFAHNAAHNRIETINPCNCGFQIVGSTGTGALEITTDGAGGLLGLDLGLDAFAIVNPHTGLSTVVGPLGLSVTSAAITWNFDAEMPLMVDPGTTALYTIDVTTGAALHVADLSQALPAPGIAMLGATGELLACAADALHRIDTATGSVTTIGSLGITNACNNLAVPPTAIACLE